MQKGKNKSSRPASKIKTKKLKAALEEKKKQKEKLARKAGSCRCGNPAVYFRKYEGNYYCKRCFIRSFEKKAKKSISKNKMINHGDTIALALSGGKDSSAMVYFMANLLKKRRDIRLIAVSVDEGINGYRKDTLKTASSLCKSLGVDHKVYTFKDIFGSTMDAKLKKIKGLLQEPCTFCGVARRYILNKASRDFKATKLCTGHCLDDEVQSVLMNYLRGDLLRASRMSALPEAHPKKKFVRRIKPFRSIPQKEVALYAILRGLEFHEDECPYMGGMRHDVGSFFNSLEEKHAGIKIGFLESFDRINPHIKKASVHKSAEIYSCESCGEPGSKKVCMTCQLWR